MQMPGQVLPHLPFLWFALACDTGSMGRFCTLVLAEYLLILTNPGSITYLMPGTVSEVSATLVESTMRRPACGLKMRFCSSAESLA